MLRFDCSDETTCDATVPLVRSPIDTLRGLTVQSGHAVLKLPSTASATIWRIVKSGTFTNSTLASTSGVGNDQVAQERGALPG